MKYLDVHLTASTAFQLLCKTQAKTWQEKKNPWPQQERIVKPKNIQSPRLGEHGVAVELCVWRGAMDSY